MKHFPLESILSFKDLDDENLWESFKEQKLFALIGNPVSKSISHITHNQIFKKIDVRAHFFRIHLEEDALPRALLKLHQRGFLGLAVTMPYKTEVLPYLNHSSGVGAVNTLLYREDGYYGENTDALAIEQLLSPLFSLCPVVSLLGAGGAARGAAYVLKKHQIPFTIYNRSYERGELLAKEYGAPFELIDRFYSPEGKFHIVINTTSVGMEPHVDACPIDPCKLSSETVVFEAIYRPHKTSLVLAAEERGLKTILGIEMFAMQALFQFRYFLSTPFDEKVLWDILVACQKTNSSPSFAQG